MFSCMYVCASVVIKVSSFRNLMDNFISVFWFNLIKDLLSLRQL